VSFMDLCDSDGKPIGIIRPSVGAHRFECPWLRNSTGARTARYHVQYEVSGANPHQGKFRTEGEPGI